MSSWLSLFKPNDDEYDDDDDDRTRPDDKPNPSSSLSSPSGAAVLKDALSQHLRGVASFLAPPPTTTTTTTAVAADADAAAPTGLTPQTINGIKNDLVEIEESFKSGLSLLSTKLTSSFMQFTKNFNDDDDDDDNRSSKKSSNYDGDGDGEYGSVEEEEEEEGGYDDGEVAGTDEEVVDFVRELSSRPEFWMDFPITLPIEFDMSDYQREHAAAIEHLVPSLVTLRQKVGGHLLDGQFWIIYFTILLPRLNEYDLKQLSTPKIVEVRETLVQKLQNERKTAVETSDCSQVVISSEKDTGFDSKERYESLSLQKSSAETVGESQEAETVNSQQPDHQWPEDDPNPTTSLDAGKHSQNEEDVSFSDLEDEDTDSLSGFRQGTRRSAASLGENNEWTHLVESSGGRGRSSLREKDSEGEDSSGWHHVDDIDFAYV